jgi:hypothetical protein
MSEREQTASSGESTASHVLGVLGVVLVILAYASNSALAVVAAVPVAVVGLVLGIRTRRESGITLSAVGLVAALALGFGVI